MRFFARTWYWFGLAAGAVALAALIVRWGDMGVPQRLLIMNFIALAIHQAEEYGWPGGEPMVMNYALMGSPTPERFPLNQLSGMVTNVAALVLVYLLPCFFPDVVWLGMAGMLFGLGQFFVHGVLTNVRMHSLYNPGLAAVALLHVPIGISYLWYVGAHGLTTGTDWAIGVALTVFVAVAIVAWPTYVIMATRRSTWPFSERELARFDVSGKLRRRGIEPAPLYDATPLARVQRRLHPRG